jgi:hypothetical protein
MAKSTREAPSSPDDRSFPSAKEMEPILANYRLDKETILGLQQTGAEFLLVAAGHKPRTGNFCSIFMGRFGSRKCNGTTRRTCCHPDRFTADTTIVAE